jgi:hypothetical protein
MKLPLVILTIIITIHPSNYIIAQSPLIKQWDKRFGGTNYDAFWAFKQTNDGGYILGGSSNSGISGDITDSGRGGEDFWVVKINAIANKQWDKKFGGADQDYIKSLQQTTDGGYILGGVSVSGFGGDKTEPSRGDYDYWTVKIDSNGNKIWDKRFGGYGRDWLTVIIQTNDNGYIIGGWSESGIGGDKTQLNWDTTLSTPDFWIVKIDSDGNKQWDKRFGGDNSDGLLSLQQTIDGGYILGGWTLSNISGDKTQPSRGQYDYWIVKVDSSGNKEWDKRFGGDNSDGLSYLIQTLDGGYLLGGDTYSEINGDKTQPSWGLTDIWIIKIDSSGIKQWDKRYGGNKADELDFGNIFLTSDGGYLLGGTSYSNISGDKTENNIGREHAWTIKIDSLGNKEWDKTIRTNSNQDDEVGLAIQTLDGCYAMAGYTMGGIAGEKSEPNWDTTNFSSDGWIIKFCDSATVQQCNLFSIAISSYTPNVSCYGMNDAAAKVMAVGGTPPFNYYWSDGQTSNTPVNFSSGTYSVTAIDQNGCIASESLTIEEGPPCLNTYDINSINSNIYFHPNPASYMINIQTENVQSSIKAVSIYDIAGRAMHGFPQKAGLTMTHATVDVSNLTNGLYFLHVEMSNGQRVVRKVVKE